MSGSLAGSSAGGGFQVTAPAVARNSNEVGSANVFLPRIDFVSDGSATFKNNAGANVADNPWGSPVTAGVGAQYWVRFTNTGGTGVYNGAGVGASWISMITGVFLGIAAAGPGNAVFRTGTYDIASDAAGASILASGTFGFISDRT